jgi:hypothetical protein
VFEDLEHLLLLHDSEYTLVGVSRVLQLGISRILMSSPVSSLEINQSSGLGLQQWRFLRAGGTSEIILLCLLLRLISPYGFVIRFPVLRN